MKQLLENEVEEINLRFEALWEYEKKVLSYKDEIKMVESSKSDTFKALAEKLEVEPPVLKKAVKEWFERKKDKEKYSEKEEILALIFEQVEKK